MFKLLGLFPRLFEDKKIEEDLNINGYFCDMCKKTYNITKYSNTYRKWLCVNCAKKLKLNYDEETLR